MAGLLAIALCACGVGKGGPPDAGSADAGPGPFLPLQPLDPDLRPCPSGWHTVTDPENGIVTCEPWPSGGRQACGRGEAHFPGGEGCEPIGTPCPAGDWADDLPAGDGVHYVRAGSAGGGRGTIESPYGRIADALDAAGDGDLIALSKGVFDEVLTVSKVVTIRGACVAETTVASSAPDENGATIEVHAAASIENLRVSGERFGIDVESLGVQMRDVLVEGATSGGVSVIGGDLVAEDLVVTGTRERPSDGALGDGLVVWSGAASVVRGVFRGNRSTAIYVTGGTSSFFASDVDLSETGYTRDGGLGYGLLVDEVAFAQIDRAVVEDDRSAGLKAVGATLNASATVVRGARGHDDGRGGGYGVYASLGSSVSLFRVTIEDVQSSGIRVWDQASFFNATDLVVRDTALGTETAYLTGDVIERGYGLDVFDGTSVSLDRAFFARNAVAGIRVLQGSSLFASNLTVASTRPDSALAGGFGLVALSGAIVSLASASFESDLVIGIASVGGSSVDATELSVMDTRPAACAKTTCADAAGGIGLFVSADGRITATRFRSDRNALCGLQIASGGSMDLHEGEVVQNPIGANVQVGGFDVTRLQDRVVYRDNDVTLDATSLPVPDGLEDLEE